MYKDDSIMSTCNDSLLRMMIDGRVNHATDADNDGKCGCDRADEGWGLVRYPLASVYSPLQSFEDLYDIEKALKRGTVFSMLDLPFEGDRRIKKGGSCRD